MAQDTALTASQIVALKALRAGFLKASGRFYEADALVPLADGEKISGAALAALVRKGLAKRSSSISASYGWEKPSYKITVKGYTLGRSL